MHSQRGTNRRGRAFHVVQARSRRIFKRGPPSHRGGGGVFNNGGRSHSSARGRGGRFIFKRGSPTPTDVGLVLMPRVVVPVPDFVEIGSYQIGTEDTRLIVITLKGNCLPELGSCIYWENKSVVGIVDDYICRAEVGEACFIVKLVDEIKAKELAGQKFFAKPATLVPLSSFLPDAINCEKVARFKGKRCTFESTSTIDRPVFSSSGMQSFLGSTTDQQPQYLINVENSTRNNMKLKCERLSRLHSMANILGFSESKKSSVFALEYGVPLDIFIQENPIDEDLCQFILLDVLEAVESLLELGFCVIAFEGSDFFVLDSGLTSTDRKFKIKYAAFEKCENILEEEDDIKHADFLNMSNGRKKTLFALSKLISKICNNVQFTPENEILLSRLITELSTVSEVSNVSARDATLKKASLKNRPLFWTFYKKLEWFVDFSQWVRKNNGLSFDNHTERGLLYVEMGGKPFGIEGWQKSMESNVRDYIEEGLVKQFYKDRQPREGVQEGGDGQDNEKEKQDPLFSTMAQKVTRLVQAYRNLIIHGQDKNFSKKSDSQERKRPESPFKNPKELYETFSKLFPALLDFCYEFALKNCCEQYMVEKYGM